MLKNFGSQIEEAHLKKGGHYSIIVVKRTRNECVLYIY